MRWTYHHPTRRSREVARSAARHGNAGAGRGTKAARTKIEHYAVEAETTLVSESLTSDAAKEFVTKIPAVETMMPVLDAGEIKGPLDNKSRLRTSRHDY